MSVKDTAAEGTPAAAASRETVLTIRNLSKENFPMVPLLLTVKEAADILGLEPYLKRKQQI